MFTGIVERIGYVQKIIHRKDLTLLCVKTNKVYSDLRLGDSVCVNGVCLTLTAKKKNFLTFELIRETIEKTTLADLNLKSAVNLEGALRMHDRLSGHVVTGHVDDIGVIKKIIIQGPSTEIQIEYPSRLRPYFVPKGSICIDGVSLTIGKVTQTFFSIYLIPWTKEQTILGLKKKDDRVNIEVDIFAKYILYKKR